MATTAFLTGKTFVTEFAGKRVRCSSLLIVRGRPERATAAPVPRVMPLGPAALSRRSPLPRAGVLHVQKLLPERHIRRGGREFVRLLPAPPDLGVQLGLVIVVVGKGRMDLRQGEVRVLEMKLFGA